MTWRRWVPALLIAAALIPSALFAWRYRDMPHLGKWHDDTVYLVSAKSLAEGHGYRILSFPGQPPQTKYPPGYPALLATIWKIAPEFPRNLPWLMLAAWLSLPLLLFSVWRLYRSWDIPPGVRLALLLFLPLNVYVTIFATNLMSELPFTALLLAVFLVVEVASARDRSSLWLTAGLLGGIAFLVRSAALPLLVAVPVAHWMRRRNWSGFQFTLVMLPFVVAWMAWSAANRVPSSNYPLVYYTDYFGDLVRNISASNFHLFIWRNLDAWMSGLGCLFLMHAEKDMVTRTLLYVVAAASMAGAVRFCIANPRARAYGFFAAAYFALVIIWCYPPNERFAIPLFPLLLVGLWWEVRRFAAKAMSVPWNGAEGLVGRAMLAGLALVFAVQFAFAWRELPADFAQNEPLERDNSACFDAIRSVVPQQSTVVSRFDGNVFLYTGRQAFSPVFPPLWMYQERRGDMVKAMSELQEFARPYTVNYLFHNRRFGGPSDDGVVMAAERAWNTDPRMELVRSCGEGRLWRFREFNRPATTAAVRQSR